jgi:NAD+ synthetase
MRVALCQIDPTVGDLDGNVERVLDGARRASAAGARLVVLPELALTGYPPRDLLDRPRFVKDGLEALRRVADGAPADVILLVGFVATAEERVGRRLYNAAAVIAGGGVSQVVHKRLLPTYDVFDEDRYFRPGEPSAPIEVDGVRIGVTICEDIWNDVDVPVRARAYENNPIADLRAAGAELIVNLSASPFTLAKRIARSDMLAGVARKHNVPIVFVNQVGGNDDLLFDGSSAIYGPDGSLWARAAAWEEDLLVADVAPGGEIRPTPETDEAAALDALTLGVRDYALKCGFREAVLGLSGGIDSALVACVAARALGPDNVLAVAMPTRYSSKGSLTDAEALANALGVKYRVIGIDDVFQSYLDELGPHLDALGPAPPGDVTFENVQARIRCAVLMAISNRFGSLLLTTGNKSEIAVGYCTLYGDMAGGLAVISDLPKTFVYRVAREINRQAGRDVVPEAILTKPPSAELRENQTDQDSLPPYDVLDAILERYVEDQCAVDDIVAAGFDDATVRRVVRMVRTNEYKRRQMPPGLIVTKKAFGPGRRYPIAQRYDR